LLLKEKKYFSAELDLAQAQLNERRLQQLNNLDNSICSTTARQHATGKACEPRAK
jgi:hypothetical protein